MGYQVSGLRHSHSYAIFLLALSACSSTTRTHGSGTAGTGGKAGSAGRTSQVRGTSAATGGGGVESGPLESAPARAEGGVTVNISESLGGRDGAGAATSSPSGGRDSEGSATLSASGGRGGAVASFSAIGGGTMVALLASGSACTADEQCSTRYCADGVCCNAACDGQCESCKLSDSVGECKAVTGDPQTPRKACAGTAPCRGQCDGINGKSCNFPDGNQQCSAATCASGAVTPKSVCNGGGACTTPSKTTCPNSQCASDGSAKCETSCTATSCAAGSYCDTGTGACIAKLDNGVACSANTQCASNACADGVCCNKDCTGCSACTVALNGQGGTARDGQCLAVVAGKAAPHGACAANASAPCGQNGLCDGANACQYPAAGTKCAEPSCSGSTLKTSTCDGAHVCAPKNDACANSLVCASETQCKSGNCAADKDCAAGYCVAGICSTTRKVGDVCTAATECPNGYCVDGYCCNEKCDGECQTCRQSPGQCRTVTTPRTGCSGSGTCGTKHCDGTHSSCVYPNTEISCGNQCSSDWTSVIPSHCNGSGACASGSPTSCGSAQYCATSSNQCTNRLANPAACSKNAQCSSSCCSNSVCADTDSDSNNCGSCGRSCGANQRCSGGSCACYYTMPAACGGGCGTFSFESGPSTKEGWGLGIPPVWSVWQMTNIAMSVSIVSSRARSGSYSLSVPITVSSSGQSAVASVQVCSAQAIDLTGKTFSAWIYLDGVALTASILGVLGWSSADTNNYQLINTYEQQAIPTRSWIKIGATLSNPPNIDYLGIVFQPDASWGGTMYIDDVQIQG